MGGTANKEVTITTPLRSQEELTKEYLKIKIYESINDYYRDLYLTKIKNEAKFSVYYAKITCMLCIDKRYVVVVVPEDSFPIGIELPLNNLQWISFQTRTFQNDIDTKLPSQNYISKKTDFMDDIIDISNREINKFTYFSRKYPIKVEI